MLDHNLITFTEAQQLALLFAQSEWSNTNKERAILLLENVSTKSQKISELQELVAFNQIEGHACLHFKSHKDLGKYQNIFSPFIERMNFLKHEQLLRLESAKPILSCFQEEQIPWVLLKGNAIAEEIYHCSYYKKMNDIDILVRNSDLDKISAIYKKLGLISLFSLSSKDHRSQEKYSHHWPSFATKNLKCLMGTHWNLASPLKSFRLEESSWWQNLDPIQFNGFDCFRLSPENFLHHLCFHLPYYKTGIKELADIFNFSAFFKNNISVARFTQKVIAAKTTANVLFHLQIANQMNPQPMLNEIICELIKIPDSLSWAEKSLLKKKTKTAESLLYSKAHTIESIEKKYAYFQLAPHANEKWKYLKLMWIDLLKPEGKDLDRLDFLFDSPNALLKNNILFKKNALLKKIAAPWTVSWYFAQDFGWKLHFLLLLKHHLVLTQTAKNDILDLIKGNSFTSLKELLSKNGVPNEIIHQL